MYVERVNTEGRELCPNEPRSAVVQRCQQVRTVISDFTRYLGPLLDKQDAQLSLRDRAAGCVIV